MSARDSDIVELDGPPSFGYGDKVRARKSVRNDGTFAGSEIGAELVHKGDVGYVAKKDMEAAIVRQDREQLWGATVLLDNGWRLELPQMPAETPLPVTVEARKLGN